LSIRLAPYILSNPEQQNDVQPKTINVLRVPEYFAEYRETGNGYAAFLGSQVVAKVGCLPLSVIDARLIVYTLGHLQ
jgi:actin-related protein 9